MNGPVSCWQLLGIEPTGDQRAIKKAYRGLLKEHGPEDDPDMFMRIREAYEQACELARDFQPSKAPFKMPPNEHIEESGVESTPASTGLPPHTTIVTPMHEPLNQQQAEHTEEPIVPHSEAQEPPEPQILQGEGEIPEAEKDWNAAPFIDRMQALFASKGWRSDVAAWQRLFSDAESLSLAARIEFRAALNHSYLQALNAIILGRYPEPDVVRLICAELKQDLEITSLQDISTSSRELLMQTEELLASYDRDAVRRSRRWSLASVAVFRHFCSPLGRTTAGNFFLTLVVVYPALLYAMTLFQNTAWANTAFLSIAIVILASFVFLSIKRWRDTGRNPFLLGLAIIPVLTVPILTMLLILDSAPLKEGEGSEPRWFLFRSRQQFSGRLKQALRNAVKEIAG